MRFERTTFIAAPRAKVFAFFAQPHNLLLITPPPLRMRIVSGPDRALREGDRLVYSLRMFGIPLCWSSLITIWRENESFADRQERGPFRSWLHVHRLLEAPGGTEMRDEVEYELPLGILGRLAAGWLVRRQLHRVFDYRGEALKARFLLVPSAGTERG